jgi:hypothetical protein
MAAPASSLTPRRLRRSRPTVGAEWLLGVAALLQSLLVWLAWMAASRCNTLGEAGELQVSRARH